MTDLSGKRVLILGAETEIGRTVTTAVAEAGASVAAVAATSDAEAAFAVQRLARRLSTGERKVIAQAIDATNEAAVRVMVRQVSKELGGLDAAVSTAYAEESEQTARSLVFLEQRAGKEMGGNERGIVIATLDVDQPDLTLPNRLPSGEVPLSPSRVEMWLAPPRALWERKSRVLIVPVRNRENVEIVADILSHIASPPLRR
jgi:hypothetical protein